MRTATITKINDGMEGVLTRFLMEPVTLGQDEDGDHITTAIVADEVPAGGRAELNRCRAGAGDAGGRARGGGRACRRRDGQVSERRQGGAGGELAGPLRQGMAVPAGTKEAAKRAFDGAVDDLIDLHRIGIWNSWYKFSCK